MIVSDCEAICILGTSGTCSDSGGLITIGSSTLARSSIKNEGLGQGDVSRFMAVGKFDLNRAPIESGRWYKGTDPCGDCIRKGIFCICQPAALPGNLS